MPAPITTQGTGLVVWAVKGVPSSFFILSALPWSAVRITLPPAASTASITLPAHWSTASTALTAASNTPVWPTMSQLAKFRMMTSYLPLSIRLTHSSATSGALISGFRS